jgi:hypothetical protein
MFTFDIEHRPGKQHANADSLSRKPCKQCGSESVNVMAVTRSQTAKAKTDHDQQIVEPSVNDNPKITSSTWLKQYSKDCIRNEQEKDSVISKVLNISKLLILNQSGKRYLMKGDNLNSIGPFGIS